MHDDGSGVVTVDAVLDPGAVQAAEAGGGKLEDRVRLGDLTAGGWTVSPWARGADGSATLTLSKPFANPDEVAGILDEVSGTVGPLKNVRAVRDRGAVSTRYDLTGDIDLTAVQTGIAADPDLVAKLTGQQVDVNALDAALAAQARELDVAPRRGQAARAAPPRSSARPGRRCRSTRPRRCSTSGGSG